jgi:nitroreductase
VKHFAPGPVDVSKVIKAIVNAPSSFGVQPYKILAVKNKELKAKLAPASYNQPQVTECDTLLIFCAIKDVEARADQYIKDAKADGIKDMLKGSIAGNPDKVGWAARQAYIALGFGLAAAAEHKIASCPMEGFNPAEVAKIMGVADTHLPVVYLALGKLNDKDKLFPRFRFPQSDLIKEFA